MTNLPQLGSTVRIVNIGLRIWPEAEKFIGADCTLCAVFMTGDTQMVAVEHQTDGVCCCFVAEMVRTPEEIEAEERIKSAYAMCGIARSLSNGDAVALYDAGYRKKPAP